MSRFSTPVILSVILFAACVTGCLQFDKSGVDSETETPIVDARPADDGSGPVEDAGPIPDAGMQDADPPTGNLALQFDGNNDLVQIMRPVAGSFTLEAWIRTTSSPTVTDFFNGAGVMFANVPVPGDDYGAVVMNDHFGFGTGNPNTTIESTTVVTTGDWVHVAATRDRPLGEIKLYVNGVEEASAVTGNTGFLNDSPTMLLGGNIDNNGFFDGLIDEVRIWNGVRSESEIASTMNTTLNGDELKLVGYWRFDDGSGPIALDRGPNGNHGLLGGGDPTAVPQFVPSDAPIQ